MYWLAKQYRLDPEDWERRYIEMDDIPEGLDSKEMEAIVHYFEAQGICFEEDEDRSRRAANFAFLYGAVRPGQPVSYVEDTRQGWADMMASMMKTFTDLKLGEKHE